MDKETIEELIRDEEAMERLAASFDQALAALEEEDEATS